MGKFVTGFRQNTASMPTRKPQKGNNQQRQQQNQGSQNAQYQKIAGTKIQVIGGEMKRIVNGDGRTFAPNDVRGAENYVAKYGGQQASRVQPMGKRQRKRNGAHQAEEELWVQPMGKPRKAKGASKGAAKGASKGTAKGASKGMVKQPIGQKKAKGASKGKGQQLQTQQHQKLKGTSIQHVQGGGFCRVVHFDGRQFAPNDIRGAESYLAKVANMSGGDKGKGKGKKQSKKGEGKGKKQREVGKGSGKGDSPSGKRQRKVKGGGKGKGKEPVGPNKKVIKKLKIHQMQKKPKKELTDEQKEEIAQKRAVKNAARIEEEGRTVVNATYLAGEVVSRAASFAWVKPLDPGAVPKEAAAKLKEMNDEFKSKAAEPGRKPFCGGIDTDVVYVRLADVAEEGFQLKPGVQCRFKLYTDSKGVGGCEVVSA